MLSTEIVINHFFGVGSNKHGRHYTTWKSDRMGFEILDWLIRTLIMVHYVIPYHVKFAIINWLCRSPYDYILILIFLIIWESHVCNLESYLWNIGVPWNELYCTDRLSKFSVRVFFNILSLMRKVLGELAICMFIMRWWLRSQPLQKYIHFKQVRHIKLAVYRRYSYLLSRNVCGKKQKNAVSNSER